MISRLARLFRPESRPLPPRSPSLEYLPNTIGDRKRDLKLGSMLPHRNAFGDFHPDMPLHPATSRPMTGVEAAAARDFKARYEALGCSAERAGQRDKFDALEYKQTYRREGGSIVPNQPELIYGTEWGIPSQPGLFPAGTVADIHSHPNVPRPGNNIPSETDHRSAHRARTNALHREGTRLDGCMMYDPVSDAFFGYTGAPTGPRGQLEYQRLYDPFPGPSAPAQRPLPALPGQGNVPGTPDGASPASSLAGRHGHGSQETGRAQSPAPSLPESTSEGRAEIGH
jgi:hypothetical protein